MVIMAIDCQWLCKKCIDSVCQCLLDKAVHGNSGKYKAELSKMSLHLLMLSNLTRDLT